jgi:hypothetical protein
MVKYEDAGVHGRISLGRVGQDGAVEAVFREPGRVAVRGGGVTRDFEFVISFGGINVGGERLIASFS